MLDDPQTEYNADVGSPNGSTISLDNAPYAPPLLRPTDPLDFKKAVGAMERYCMFNTGHISK
jgi:hypothetical protein